jgi:alanyl-tRNA synthetase
MKLLVDSAQRYAKMRSHTAAHLLHASLAAVFPDTKQAGSFVDEDYLRFDFVAERALTLEELSAIQQQVNAYIYAALPVETHETSYDEAITLWAKAFFEDKYGDVVRVVKIDQDVSTELCGWTHASNTKDIGCFAILSQEAVASGIKRIVAVTWPKVFEFVQEKDAILDALAKKLGVSPKQVVDKTEKVLKDYESLQSSFEILENKLIGETLRGLPNKNTYPELHVVLQLPNDINFKIALWQARILFEGQNFLLYTQEWTFALVMQSGAKEMSTKLGLKGWGSENMVQGRDVSVLHLFA